MAATKSTETKAVEETSKVTSNKTSTKQNKKSSNSKAIKLPKYLRLAKGSMWFDIEGNNASGVRLFVPGKVFVGRGRLEDEKEPPKDMHNNENYREYGVVEKDLTWYIDTTKIPKEKQSRILKAYKHKILVKADPKNPPKLKPIDYDKNLRYNKDGDMVFSGRNKEMYRKLMNSDFKNLRDFVTNCPINANSRSNLLDLLDYEQRGYNKFSRPRGEVMDMIRDKLNEFSPGISSIRVND